MNDPTKPIAPTLNYDALEFHPLAGWFDLLEGDEFDALVDSIRRNGLLQQVVLHEGKVLAGRNRYRACKTASYRFSAKTSPQARTRSSSYLPKMLPAVI